MTSQTTPGTTLSHRTMFSSTAKPPLVDGLHHHRTTPATTTSHRSIGRVSFLEHQSPLSTNASTASTHKQLQQPKKKNRSIGRVFFFCRSSTFQKRKSQHGVLTSQGRRSTPPTCWGGVKRRFFTGCTPPEGTLERPDPSNECLHCLTQLPAIKTLSDRACSLFLRHQTERKKRAKKRSSHGKIRFFHPLPFKRRGYNHDPSPPSDHPSLPPSLPPLNKCLDCHKQLQRLKTSQIRHFRIRDQRPLLLHRPVAHNKLQRRNSLMIRSI